MKVLLVNPLRCTWDSYMCPHIHMLHIAQPRNTVCVVRPVSVPDDVGGGTE